MVTKCNTNSIEECLLLLDKIQVIQLRIWKSTSNVYNLTYLTLSDIEKDKNAYIKSEECLNTTQALTCIEKIINLLKEFKNANESGRVKEFSIDFSCYKRSTPQFTYSVSFKENGMQSASNIRNGVDDTAPVVAPITEEDEEYISILKGLPDNTKIPGLFLRMETSSNSKNKGRKYQEITLSSLKEIILGMRK